MRINKRALHEALSILVRVIDKKSTVAALQHLKLAAYQGTVSLTATNLEQTVSCEIPGEGELTVCLPARILSKIVKPESKKDDGFVDISIVDNTAVVNVDGITTKLIPADVQDFPQGQEQEWNLVALWPSKPLIESLEFVLPAASNDETRPHICCVSLNENQIATTDGHRLHCSLTPSPLTEQLLLPVPSAQILQHILKNAEHVVIAKSEDRLKMKVGPWTLETKLTDAVFPPVDQVVPKTHAVSLSVDSKAFSKALKRIGALSNSRGVKMVVNGAITLESSDPDVGEVSVQVQPLENDHCGEDIVAGFNMAYLLDAIGKDADKVQIQMNGPLDPLRIDLEGGRVGVVMPMRV